MALELPILYSFRRCPYAIRARLALKVSGTKVELREVKLASKPKQMLECSAKGTVPVLQLNSGEIIDESLDIMHWALLQNDPQGWLATDNDETSEMNRLVKINDFEFKQHLDHYKYSERFPMYTAEYYREQAEVFIKTLELNLQQKKFLVSDKITLADMAIFPFVRQFAFVDKNWFDSTSYTNCQIWLDRCLNMFLFNEVMEKIAFWKDGDEMYIF